MLTKSEQLAIWLSLHLPAWIQWQLYGVGRLPRLSHWLLQAGIKQSMLALAADIRAMKVRWYWQDQATFQMQYEQ